jgi:rod shape-determining protein MreB and related proteins
MKGPLSFARQFLQQSPRCYFDFGSTTTRVLVVNRLVYCEPTCMVIHSGDKTVVAIGTKAYGLLGKTPPSLEIVFPVLRGSWISLELAQLYCQAIQKSVGVRWSIPSYLFGVAGLSGVSTSLSVAERRTATTVFRQVGFQQVKLVPRPQAIFQHRRASKTESEVAAILDLGGQLAEASVLVGGENICSAVFSWGGVRLTEKTQALVRSLHSCALGWQTAEEVKRQLVRMYAGVSKTQGEKWRETKLAVRGKDVVTQTAKTVVLTAAEFERIGEQALEELEEYLHDFLASVPVELGATVLSQGLLLSGGSSQIKGLAEALEKITKCQVFTSTRPELDVVEGLSELKNVS